MKEKILLFLFILKFDLIFCQTNDFKIGIFGFDFMTNSSYDCSNFNYCPLTSTLYNGYPSSQGNVLNSDGFNIMTNYFPNCYESSITFMSGLLQLLKNNNLQYLTHTRQYYKPNQNVNPSIENGTNIYNFSQNSSSICQARPNFDILFNSNVYANSLLKTVVWGHQITEEASYQHPFNPTDNFINWDSPQNIFTEVPPQNVSDAIRYFRQRKNSLGVNNQRLVVMEAHHGKAIWENVVEDTWQNPINNFQPCDYLKMPNVNNANLPDVFFEGSYFHFPEDSWWAQTYANMFTNNGDNSRHYLGGQKSIDWAYTHVSEVHDVIGTEINCEDCEHQYHAQLSIKNANWLWFQAYSSIIHNAKGIWFWDLPHSWQNGESKATGVDRFELANFSIAYKRYIRHLAKELRYQVNKNLISTNPLTIVSTKTDVADPNNIIKNYQVPQWPTGITIAQIQELSTNNYGLRYTIRTNGEETEMIIVNPLGCSVITNLDFTNFTNDIVRNSLNYNILFESSYPNLSLVNSPTYKTDRNSTIDLSKLIIGKNYSSGFRGSIDSLAFGAVDVHIIKFGPINNQWFDETRDKSSNLLQLNSEIKCSASGDNVYYVRNDGILHVIYPVNGIWTTNWINGDAPKVLQGTGLGIDVSTNNLYYVSSSNKKVYRMFYSGSSWQYEQIDNSNNNVRSDSRIIYSQGNVFYVRDDGIIHVIYKSNGGWTTSWLNGSAKAVKTGIGMAIAPGWNCPIYYQGTDGLIYNITWNNQWNVSKIYNSNVDIRQNSELHYGNGQIFFVRSDGIIHQLYKDATHKWVIHWLNGNAPKVKMGTDLALSTDGGVNTIYYIAEDDFIYQFKWASHNGWQASKISPTVFIKGRDNVDVHFLDGKIYYGGSDTKVHALYYNGNNDLNDAMHYRYLESSGSSIINDFTSKVDCEKLSVYPNPANNELNIICQLKCLSNLKILLYNIYGQKIKEIFNGERDKGVYIDKVDVSNISSGIYIVKVLTNKNASASQKVIIQKQIL